MRSTAVAAIGALGFVMTLTVAVAGDQPITVVGVRTATARAGAVDAAPEPRWGRAALTWDPERYPSNRADWHDVPAQWELRRVADVQEIPAPVREALQQSGCSIPRYRHARVETSVVWGAFERPGQRDLAVLCARADRTSSTYVFLAADPARRLVMPKSGNSILTAPRAAVESRLDPDKPLEPDMPATVDHDAIEIGCCECCSTIFYRHGGRWFTLPGAD